MTMCSQMLKKLLWAAQNNWKPDFLFFGHLLFLIEIYIEADNFARKKASKYFLIAICQFNESSTLNQLEKSIVIFP